MAEAKAKTVKKTTVSAKGRSTAGGKKAAPVKKTAAVKAVKPEKKAVVEPKASKAPAKETMSLTLNVLDLSGKAAGKLTLPVEMFGEKVNKRLLAQAVRVYLANKRQGTVSTKNRSEVEGSSRKIYRQKGTGRARHGTVRAPIFVHGGLAHGPKPRDFSLDLPKKMRRKALFSALSAKMHDGEVKIVTGFEKMEPKTKQFAKALKNLGAMEKKVSALVVCPTDLDNVKRAGRNIQGLYVTAAKRLNAYDVIRCRQLLLTKEAIDEMKKSFLQAK